MANDQLHDEDLLARFRDPKTREQAFTELVDKYQKRLYNHIRRLVIVHEDADDVLQNTFMKVWKHLANFKGGSQLYTWLYRIATNESFNHLKKQKKQASASFDHEDYDMANKFKADPYIDGDEIQMKLQKAIHQLPERQRAVFIMRYYDEMKYEEIAEIMERSEGALKASYHHAAKKIEQFVKNH